MIRSPRNCLCFVVLPLLKNIIVVCCVGVCSSILVNCLALVLGGLAFSHLNIIILCYFIISNLSFFFGRVLLVQSHRSHGQLYSSKILRWRYGYLLHKFNVFHIVFRTYVIRVSGRSSYCLCWYVPIVLIYRSVVV